MQYIKDKNYSMRHLIFLNIMSYFRCQIILHMLKGLFYIFLGIILACSCDSKSKKQDGQEKHPNERE